MSETITTSNWDHVGQPTTCGRIKTAAEDFRVEELLGYELEDSGEHIYLFIEKRGVNTQDLMHTLARKLMVHPKYISFSGLKDKHAVTRQWLSIYTHKEIDIAALESPDIRILRTARHPRKLKRGSHQANAFEIVIRDLKHTRGLEQDLQRVQQQGVPNYFGEQRFGRRGGNVEGARKLFSSVIDVDRHQRGLYLSAARSFLFNEVLAERVRQHCWDTGLQGEAMMLDGSNSFFKTEAMDEALQGRLAEFDIHPSAPLWGKGDLASSGDAYELEVEIIDRNRDLAQGLEEFGLRQQRRATRLIPKNLQYEFLDSSALKLSFTLIRGAFATTVLRELITIDG